MLSTHGHRAYTMAIVAALALMAAKAVFGLVLSNVFEQDCKPTANWNFTVRFPCEGPEFDASIGRFLEAYPNLEVDALLGPRVLPNEDDLPGYLVAFRQKKKR